MKLDWPLMENNITREDLDTLIEFLKGMPRLTQGDNVRDFEREWSEWLGVRHSVFVNSGASANLLTMAAMKHLYGGGQVIVPAFAWVSDIAAILRNGLVPVFADINPRNLCLDEEAVLARLNRDTRAVFMIHAQGFNGLTERLLKILEEKGIHLIEDVCEAHGAEFGGRKLGTFGLASNFSFYFAHHLSTIEGGMICTGDEDFHQTVLMMRSHGLVREATSEALKQEYARKHPDLAPDFMFAFPSFNFRNTEIGAVLGRSRLKHLERGNARRKRNFKLFLEHLDPEKYRTGFDLRGSCNYALNLVLRRPDSGLRDRVESTLLKCGVEFRRGSSGGGNQLRQPYLKPLLPEGEYLKYPEVEHLHFYGYYIGNYPDLEEGKILALCGLLNRL